MQVDGTVAGSVYYLEAIVPVWHNSGMRTWRSDLWTPRGAVRGGGGISINSEPFIDSQKGCLTSDTLDEREMRLASYTNYRSIRRMEMPKQIGGGRRLAG